jgi:hypothetical protein
VGAWAWSDGDAALTPSGNLNVSCTNTVGLSHDSSTSWPAGTFTRSAPCSTMITTDPAGWYTHPDGWEAKVYQGQGRVAITGTGQVALSCHASYSSTFTATP